MSVITPEDDFSQEHSCKYKDELYAVRDNGSVFRYPRENARVRKFDNIWTFGKTNPKTGYKELASVRVHRIVALAFHGEPLSKEYIVDHIDTNKQNNRPENLRWLTRLENILLNPITVKRIESICNCKIEEFIANPQQYRHLLSTAPTNIQWMRTVTSQQGEECLKNLTSWANSDKTLKGKSIGEWIYYRTQVYSEAVVDEVFKRIEKKTGMNRQVLCFNKAKKGNYHDARVYAAKQLRSEINLSDYQIGRILGLSATTIDIYLEASPDIYSGDFKEFREREFQKRIEITAENRIQKNWSTKSEFPSCPNEVQNNPIAEYAKEIKDNTLFMQNAYYQAMAMQCRLIDAGNALLVMYEIERDDRDKRWGIMKITFEYEKFVFELITNYNGTQEHYNLEDVENHFNSIIDGTKWTPLYDSQGRRFIGEYMPL